MDVRKASLSQKRWWRFFYDLWEYDMRQNHHVVKMTLSALFLAMAYVLPFLTGQIPEIGAMLCPLHIPALLCGFICGWPWGMAVG